MWRALLIAVLAATSVRAETLDIGAPENAERTAHRVRAFDSYSLPIGVFSPRGGLVEAVEGEVTWQAYRLARPEASSSGVIEGYAARLEELGFETVFRCRADACGGFDFRFGAAILPPPAMLLDVRDFEQHTAMRLDPPAYVSVLVSRVRETVYVQTVSVVPADPSDLVGPAPELRAETEVAVMPADERALLDVLLADGHVTLGGLSFEEGGTGLEGQSAEALDLLARLLNRDAALEVVIVGHSDNRGGLETNLQLSERRAAAVLEALVERGVPAGQIEARGIGFLAPLASNATPEGRARNRRVELVLRRAP